LNILVCVKQTIDTAATVSVEDGKISGGEAPLVLNPWDEFAVEEALRTKEAQGGQVTVLSLGPQEAREALKQALAMGCDAAVLVTDPAFEGTDSLATSKAIAAAITKMGDVELVFFGRTTVDYDTGVTSAQVARRLNWPSLSLVAAVVELDAGGKSITVERMLEDGRQVVRGKLPAVVSVVKEINEPRYPSFMGIRKASRMEIPEWSAADLGLTEVPQGVLRWPEVYAPPKVETHCELIEGGSPDEIAKKMVDRLVEEKVL
jgi:electron transfer flavoprotein beta subunit